MDMRIAFFLGSMHILCSLKCAKTADVSYTDTKKDDYFSISSNFGDWSSMDTKNQGLNGKFGDNALVNGSNYMKQGQVISKGSTTPFLNEYLPDYTKWNNIYGQDKKLNDASSQIPYFRQNDYNFGGNNMSVGNGMTDDATLPMNWQNNRDGNVNLGLGPPSTYNIPTPTNINREADLFNMYQPLPRSRMENGKCDCFECLNLPRFRYLKDPLSNPLVININSDCMPPSNGNMFHKFVLKPNSYMKPFFPRKQRVFARFPPVPPSQIPYFYI
ncbi:UNVERIFIED_CONTAM: hypothetical protein PYX00_001114 [Menopon gallinae]|uniref:Uncharacterized protein n=1 Tax=Menopon gallinae TaxID=328185 RepID=A0AAW2IDL6_9NEOP